MRPTRTSAFLTIALVLAVGLVIALARRLDTLSGAYRELQLLSTTLHRGSVVPAFSSRTAGGRDVMVGGTSDSTGKQLVFLFTTTCPYCLKSLQAWKLLTDSIAGRDDPRVTAIGISLDSLSVTDEYRRRHQLNFDITFFPDSRSKRLFRSSKVPQTVVVDFDGHVVYSHVGVLEVGKATDSVLMSLAPTKFSTASVNPLLSRR